MDVQRSRVLLQLQAHVRAAGERFQDRTLEEMVNVRLTAALRAGARHGLHARAGSLASSDDGERRAERSKAVRGGSRDLQLAIELRLARNLSLFQQHRVTLRIQRRSAGVLPRARARRKVSRRSGGTSAGLAELVNALAAALLAHNGQVRLDAPVGPLVPELPQVLGRATLAQLLTHTGGLARQPAAPGRGGADDLGAAARQLTQLDRVTDPGIMYSTSPIGVSLAGLVLERSAKKPYAQLLRAL